MFLGRTEFMKYKLATNAYRYISLILSSDLLADICKQSND